MEDVYAFLRLTGQGRSWKSVHESVSTALPDASIWGAFRGLFGIASNELIVMTVGEDSSVAACIETVQNLVQVELTSHLKLRPTVRPTHTSPLTRDGLYVLRFFDVANRDVDEIVDLSMGAWTNFENIADFQVEPKGLFCQRDRTQERGKMLLLTWYDGLDSWQASRAPAESNENFRRRHRLTAETIAYATRLVLS